jgi:hypothetical protein
MKKLCVFLVIGCIGGSAFAFDILSYPPPVSGGNILIDAGVGFGIGYEGDLLIPPLFAQVDYALPKIPISIGGNVSYWRNGYDRTYVGYDVEWTYNYLAILARGNWHWGFNVKWLDFYTGLSIGYRAFWEEVKVSDSSYKMDKNNYSGMDWGLQLGAHFYFTEKVGAMIELGYPMSRIGISFKI